MKYLFDTNQLGAVFKAKPPILKRMRDAEKQGHRLGTCIPVICELEAGLHQTERFEENRKRLRVLLSRLTLWPLEVQTAQLFGEIHRELKAHGRKLSHVDMVVAALARQLDATVVTTDRDFEALPDIKTENWLA